MQKLGHKERGFIALMSIIIISAIVSVLLITVSQSLLYTRYNILDREYALISKGLARSCVEKALLRVALDTQYRPPETGDCVSVADSCADARTESVCRICSVEVVSGEVLVETDARYRGAYAVILARAGTSTGEMHLESLHYLATSTHPRCVLP